MFTELDVLSILDICSKQSKLLQVHCAWSYAFRLSQCNFKARQNFDKIGDKENIVHYCIFVLTCSFLQDGLQAAAGILDMQAAAGRDTQQAGRSEQQTAEVNKFACRQRKQGYFT